MPFEIFIAIAALLVAVILMALKTNAAVVFFSLCAGSVLASQLGGEASLFLSSFIKDGDMSRAITSIGMIVLPAIFSALFLKGTVNSSKLIFNLLPSLAAGALAVLLVVPFIPGGSREGLMSNQAWDYLDRFQPLILVGGILSGILLLWLNKPKHKKDKKHK